MASTRLPTWVTIETDFPTSRERRGEVRHAIQLGVKVGRTRGGASWALLQDVSRSGFRFATGIGLQPGHEIVVCLPDGSSVEGTVVWQSDIQFGVNFHQRLSRAAVATLRLAAFPTQTQFAPRRALGMETTRSAPKALAIRDLDLAWIAPIWGMMHLWFFAVDTYFLISGLLSRVKLLRRSRRV